MSDEDPTSSPIDTPLPPSRARKLTSHEAGLLKEVIEEGIMAQQALNRSKIELARMLMLIEPGIDDPDYPYTFDNTTMAIVEKPKKTDA